MKTLKVNQVYGLVQTDSWKRRAPKIWRSLIEKSKLTNPNWMNFVSCARNWHDIRRAALPPDIEEGLKIVYNEYIKNFMQKLSINKFMQKTHSQLHAFSKNQYKSFKLHKITL
jgi:hypothetical protein